jgi:hypothetical protein
MPPGLEGFVSFELDAVHFRLPLISGINIGEFYNEPLQDIFQLLAYSNVLHIRCSDQSSAGYTWHEVGQFHS